MKKLKLFIHVLLKIVLKNKEIEISTTTTTLDDVEIKYWSESCTSKKHLTV